MKDNPIDWMVLSQKDDSRVKLRFSAQFEMDKQIYIVATKEVNQAQNVAKEETDHAQYVILKVVTQGDKPELHEIIDDTEWHQADLYYREHYADLLY